MHTDIIKEINKNNDKKIDYPMISRVLSNLMEKMWENTSLRKY